MREVDSSGTIPLLAIMRGRAGTKCESRYGYGRERRFIHPYGSMRRLVWNAIIIGPATPGRGRAGLTWRSGP